MDGWREGESSTVWKYENDGMDDDRHDKMDDGIVYGMDADEGTNRGEERRRRSGVRERRRRGERERRGGVRRSPRGDLKIEIG